MPKLRVHSFAMSIDGYGAGPNQDLENPLGVRGPELMDWVFHTRLWRTMQGERDGETGVDNDRVERGFADETLAALQTMGHVIVTPLGQTSANSIAVTPYGLLGAPDPRTRGSEAAGQ